MHRTIKLLLAAAGVTATVAGVAVAATTPSVSTGKATSPCSARATSPCASSTASAGLA